MELTELTAQIDTLKSELNNVKAELRSLELALTSSIENRYVQLECLHRLYSLVPGLGPLPPTRGWAASPDFLMKIAEVILNEKPKFILELGSGVSTFVIKACCDLIGNSTALSIDHNSEYLSITEGKIQRTMGSTVINFKHCPLKEHKIEQSIWLWYDLPLSCIKSEIELLIVDGPPRKIHKNSRYPAVMYLHSKFADKSKILLDDYNRIDEQETVTFWMKDLNRLGFNVELEEFAEYEKGLAVLSLERKL
jgi:hypothetical protein